MLPSVDFCGGNVTRLIIGANPFGGYSHQSRGRMISKAEGITYTLGKAGRIWLHGEVRGTPAPVVNVRTLTHDLAVVEVLVLFTEELREAIPQCPFRYG